MHNLILNIQSAKKLIMARVRRGVDFSVKVTMCLLLLVCHSSIVVGTMQLRHSSSRQLQSSDSGVPTLSPAVVPFASESPISPFISVMPSYPDTSAPSEKPTASPTIIVSSNPSQAPTIAPTMLISNEPTMIPPSFAPTTQIPSFEPTTLPTEAPIVIPTTIPTTIPTLNPSAVASAIPTLNPSEIRTTIPTLNPSSTPTFISTALPTQTPTLVNTAGPTIPTTVMPTVDPTLAPSAPPSEVSTFKPTANPTSIVLPPSMEPEAPDVYYTNFVKYIYTTIAIIIVVGTLWFCCRGYFDRCSNNQYSMISTNDLSEYLPRTSRSSAQLQRDIEIARFQRMAGGSNTYPNPFNRDSHR